jgi:Rrf2 family protein
MLSRTAEYALRASVYLGERGTQRSTTQQIAEVTQVPAGYLAKVMQNLARAGLVTGQRGVNGGFCLARDPGEISLWDIVQAVGTFQRIESCPLGLEEHAHELCPLHRRLDDAVAHIESTFRDASLADLLERATFPEGAGLPTPDPDPRM